MNPLSDVTNPESTTRTARSRRHRTTSAILAGVLALGVGVGVTACSSSTDEAPVQDKVAVANAAASKQADAASIQYQQLAASIATGVDLLAASQGKVDDAALAELTSALDAARAIDPTTSFRDLDTVEEAQAKEQALVLATNKMTEAKATLDAAITATQGATATAGTSQG